MRVFRLVWLVAALSVVALASAAGPPVKLGNEVLAAHKFQELAGKRVASSRIRPA